MNFDWLEIAIGTSLLGLGLLAGIFRLHIVGLVGVSAIISVILSLRSAHLSRTAAGIGLLQVGYVAGLILVGLLARRTSGSSEKQAGKEQ